MFDGKTTKTESELWAEIERLRALVLLGDFSSLRPNSESFKLVQQIRREQSTGEQRASCSTCGGSGEIDERLGGIATSGIVPCPDCNGKPFVDR